ASHRARERKHLPEVVEELLDLLGGPLDVALLVHCLTVPRLATVESCAAGPVLCCAFGGRSSHSGSRSSWSVVSRRRGSVRSCPTRSRSPAPTLSVHGRSCRITSAIARTASSSSSTRSATATQQPCFRRSSARCGTA